MLVGSLAVRYFVKGDVHIDPTMYRSEYIFFIFFKLTSTSFFLYLFCLETNYVLSLGPPIWRLHNDARYDVDYLLCSICSKQFQE